MSDFTKEELELLTVSQLRTLARYYDLQFDPRSRKQELINLIPKKEEPIPEVSVRIRRIRESQKGD